MTWSFHLFVAPSNQQFLVPSSSSQTDDITNHYRTKNKLIDDRTREWTQRRSLFGPTTAAHLQSVSGLQLHIRYTLITSDGSSVFLIPGSGCEVTRWHPEAAGLNLTSCKWPTLLSVYINILYTLHPCYIQKEIEIQPTAKVTFMSCLCCVGTSSPGLLRHQKNHTTQRSEVENRAPNPSTTTEPHRTPHNPTTTGPLEAQQNSKQTDQNHKYQQLYLYRHKPSEDRVRTMFESAVVLTSGVCAHLHSV